MSRLLSLISSNFYPPQHSLIKALRKNTLAWFTKCGRDFPWRKTKNPYKILIAELMLRRTRAQQVVPIYKEFFAAFPTVTKFSHASRREIRCILRSLGLNWRIENFVELAKTLRRQHSPALPTKQANLRRLPGVGDYVAGATTCFSEGAPVTVIDANVVRVLTRYFGMQGRGEMRRNKRFIQLATMSIDPKHPREYTWGVLDLGALVCIPGSPDCPNCPLRKTCTYNRLRTQRKAQT